MKILVTGAKGMLGTDLVRILEESEHKVFATDIEELDITQFDSVKKMVRDISPDVVVNCAAYTDVDKAEEEPDKAFLINGVGVQNLALVCKDLDINLCHISTDYVFDGTKGSPYTPDDIPNPINTYGRSKLAGEEHVQKILNKFYIVRTSWLYGKHGKNFVSTILNLAKKQKVLRVVDDQRGSPTWTVTLAQAIAVLIQTQKYGIYHITDKTENGISWYQFAVEIVRLSGHKAGILPVKTVEFPQPARRPKYSVLDLTRTVSILNHGLPSWEDSLKQFINN
jgi:dTDP-4-dehydrorhamnose reductase